MSHAYINTDDEENIGNDSSIYEDFTSTTFFDDLDYDVMSKLWCVEYICI